MSARMKKSSLMTFAMALVLLACAPTTPEPTATPRPTETPMPSPTATAAPTNTPTPSPTIASFKGFTASDCALEWNALMLGLMANGFVLTEEVKGTAVDLILNTNSPPDSRGFVLRSCINGGWTGWREPAGGALE